MSLLSKKTNISRSLRVKHDGPGRISWWLKDDTLIPLAQLIVETFWGIIEDANKDNIHIFKLNNRKAVFRIKHPENAQREYVAKVSFYNRIKHRFRFRKYVLNEATNLLKARTLGINTPQILGYGSINDAFGLPEVSIIATEYLPGFSSIGVLMGIKSETERKQMFMKTIPLFVSLYNTNCNHIDVTSRNVLLSDNGFNPDVFLLDFQYARFNRKPNIEILMFEAGYFAKSCCNFISTQTIYEWLDGLLSIVNSNGKYDTKTLKKRFEYYLNVDFPRKKQRISIK